MHKFKFNDKMWMVAVPILVTVTSALFSYRYTLAEPDIVRMVAGIVYGGVTGDHIFAGYHYGLKFSFGFYEILYHLIPENLLIDPDYVAKVINDVGIVFAFIFAVGLSLMLNKLFDRGVPVFCAVGFLFSPVVLPFLASGHPLIGGCAFLFLGCWLVLVAGEKSQPATTALYLTFAFAALTIGLCLRGEVVLAFPFIAAAYWVKSPKNQHNWLFGLAVGLVLTLAFGYFLYLQRPFIASEGRAVSSVLGFLSEYLLIGQMLKGVGIVVLAQGIVTAILLLLAIALRVKDRNMNLPLVLVCLALSLPSLLFWVANPTPARHFIIAILGLYLLLGQLWIDKLNNVKAALFLSAWLVFGNQAIAELGHLIIVNSFHWSNSYGADRKASQKFPLGFFPLDQQANKAAEDALRAEAVQVVAAKPQRLIILADSEFYLVARLLADDTSLRLLRSKIGNFPVLLLKNTYRQIYIVSEKYLYWPRDVLAEILERPEVVDYAIYVQPATVTKYDKVSVPKQRAFPLHW
ncbi:MAG: hypothetical protein HOP02_10030 [Methylococcaceae bacterium]|nr:hypothetical protein [Methylococcaceae bacterium]